MSNDMYVQICLHWKFLSELRALKLPSVWVVSQFMLFMMMSLGKPFVANKAFERFVSNMGLRVTF